MLMSLPAGECLSQLTNLTDHLIAKLPLALVNTVIHDHILLSDSSFENRVLKHPQSMFLPKFHTDIKGGT
jgi:hypothetical protein